MEDLKKSGKSTDQAIAVLEDQRNGKSLSQLHKLMQPKKKKNDASTEEQLVPSACNECS